MIFTERQRQNLADLVLIMKKDKFSVSEIVFEITSDRETCEEIGFSYSKHKPGDYLDLISTVKEIYSPVEP